MIAAVSASPTEYTCDWLTWKYQSIMSAISLSLAPEPENSAYGISRPGTRRMRVKFENYDLDPSIYDEMFLPDGAPREHCTQVYETLTQLSEEELVNIQDRVTRSFSNEGINIHGLRGRGGRRADDSR